MKKIINSKKYDTEKAKKIGTYWYLEPGNINHIYILEKEEENLNSNFEALKQFGKK
jgi:hypothetical protein